MPVRQRLAVPVILLSLAACDTDPRAMDATDETLVAEGAMVYEAHCAQCHGASLEGQPDWKTPLENGMLPAPPHDETGHTWHHGDALLFRYVKEGGQSVVPDGFTSGMPAFGEDLSDRQIWAVLSFIKSTWSPEFQARQEARNR